MEPRAGFDPATTALPIMDEWKEYLLNNYARTVAKTYYNYGTKYSELLFSRNFFPLKQLLPEKRLHIIRALCCLSKYVGKYDVFKHLMKVYDLKWSTGNKDALILKKLFNPRNQDNDLKKWIQTVKKTAPNFSLFLDFMISTGLRKIESINSCNLIIDLFKTNKLNDYYSNNMLQHFRFPKMFLRPTKKAFLSIIPSKLVEEIGVSNKLTIPTINKLLQRRQIPHKFCDIREYWATKMTKYLSQSEIDFLQGRVGSIFMKHYFNPTLIHDLKIRTLEGIRNLVEDNMSNRISE